MPFIIRRAKQEDIPSINKLLFQVHKVHSDLRPDLFLRGSKKYTDEELKNILNDENKPVFVAEKDGEVLGYAFCVIILNDTKSLTGYTSLYIDDLCVDERSRGQNVGKCLYAFVTDFARKIGCHNITLNVWEGNESAKKFYEKIGLKIQKYGMEQILDVR